MSALAPPDVADRVFGADLDEIRRDTDRIFRWLLLAQWGVAVVIALVVSPWSYDGPTRTLHLHVQAAVVIGGALCVAPLVLIAKRPGWWLTRHVVTATQMLFSALLIHITGGRIETHFHIFGSLAFVAFYRDWRLLITATAAVALDHLLRGMLWPTSVYGVVNPEWWRFLEHAAWVGFENTVLIFGIGRSLADLRRVAVREAALTEVNAAVERQVRERTAELEASREQFRSLVEGTRAAAWEFLPDEDRSRYVAPQIEALFGYPPERFGEPGFGYTLVHPEDVARVRDEVVRAIAEGVEFEVEVRMFARDGGLVHVRSVGTPVREGSTTVLRGITFDITPHIRIAAELREAQKLESLGRMAAGVAHEINTPLQYIANNVEFLGLVSSRLISTLEAISATEAQGRPANAGPGPVEAILRRTKVSALAGRVPAAIAATHDGVRAVERIVGTLQNIHGGSVTPASISRIEIDDLLGGCVAELTGRSPAVRVDVVCDPTIGSVDGDPAALRTALVGLLRNAAEASAQSGDVDATVRLVAARRGHLVEIAIEDTGPGIPEAIRHRIFDPFFTTKGVGHGSGEGLHRCRDIIVGGHAGELTCERTGSHGTTFLVRLPASARPQRAA